MFTSLARLALLLTVLVGAGCSEHEAPPRSPATAPPAPLPRDSAACAELAQLDAELSATGAELSAPLPEDPARRQEAVARRGAALARRAQLEQQAAAAAARCRG